jgi:hypothetical protein
MACHELRSRHEPLTQKVLQVLPRDLGRGPILFRHDLEGTEKLRSVNPKTPSLLLRCREEDEKTMTNCVREHKGVQGHPFGFIAPWCHNRGGKATGP